MNSQRLSWMLRGALVIAVLGTWRTAAGDVSIGGFIPYVGIALTRQFDTFDSDPNGTFFIADPRYTYGGTPMGPGGTPYFDLALLDTGAATHILTESAASASGFGIATPFSGEPDGFAGTNFQTIFGASGPVELRINDPLGIYAAGLGDRASSGASLTMNTAPMRGQSSIALLEAPSEWTLPNIVGLPMAAHHGIAIRNSDPQIFQYQGRTVRTPQIDFIDLGSGDEEGILRRADLRLRPSAGFLQGPFYLQNPDIFSLKFHENPLSPSVVENGGLYVEVDLANGSHSFQDKELLFDTGADLTVLSSVTAKRLGFDALVDEPDFFLEVEGAGGISGGVPGFYLDELNIDTVGGNFTLTNVPVAVLDLPNPNDPGNVVDGILGMHVFNGRDIVIDANPAASSAGGAPPRLYISDPVSQTHNWASGAASANWSTPASWSAPGVPEIKWAAKVANTSGSDQSAVVTQNSTIFTLEVSGTPSATMTVQIDHATLTTFGETLIKHGGRIELAGGKLDAQFVNLDGGTLSGVGEVFAGTGPISSPVRNLSGRIEPGSPVGQLTIDGDLSQQEDGILAIDLAGPTAISQHDQLAVTRYAFLGGTLEVNLLSYTPSVGSMFTILTTGEEVVGEFDQLVLPGGFLWDVAYNASSVVLSVAGLGLAGDFNGDGAVDAADYAVWRRTGGTPAEYAEWRANFGMTSAGSASGAQGVPEPGAAALLLIGLAGCACRARCASRRAPCAGSKCC